MEMVGRQVGVIWQEWSDRYHISFTCRVQKEFFLLSRAVQFDAEGAMRGRYVLDVAFQLEVISQALAVGVGVGSLPAVFL